MVVIACDKYARVSLVFSVCWRPSIHGVNHWFLTLALSTETLVVLDCSISVIQTSVPPE